MRGKLTVALTHAATFGPDIAAVQSMKHPSENQSQEVLAGLVERVTYHNVENGFCVLRVKARGLHIDRVRELLDQAMSSMAPTRARR
jgi:hypothetical protein